MSKPVFHKDLFKNDMNSSKDTLDGLQIFIGVDAEGKTKYIDLNKDAVHLRITGNTGLGKSNLFHVVINRLASKYSPKWVQLALADFKSKEVHPYLKGLHQSHILHVSEDASVDYMLKMLSGIQIIIDERSMQLHPFSNIEDYNRAVRNRGTNKEIMPRGVVILEEFQWGILKANGALVEPILMRIRSILKTGSTVGVHVVMFDNGDTSILPEDILDYFSTSVRFISRGKVNVHSKDNEEGPFEVPTMRG
jgi:DNA segregation ATPase FtsK/SpoIIIE-like protein